jgi:type IV secretory pathway VirB4 component
MNQETRFSGHWIVAQQGMGKTTLLLNMLASDLRKDASIIIMDAKGDLINATKHLDLGERLIVLDEEPFAINPLDVPKTDVRRAVNFLEYIFDSIGPARGNCWLPKPDASLSSQYHQFGCYRAAPVSIADRPATARSARLLQSRMEGLRRN